MKSRVVILALICFTHLMSLSHASESVIDQQFAQQIANRISISPEENAWIQRAPVLRFRVAENSPEQYFEDGKAVGLSVDYAQIICTAFKLRCEFVPYLGGSFAEALNKIGDPDGPDIMLTGRSSPERKKFALFTKPYLFTPSVILTRTTSPNIFSLSDLAGKKVVIERGYLIGKLLEENIPDIQLISVDNTSKALETLAGGIGDAYVGNLTTSTFLSSKLNLTNLKIAAPTNFPIQGESMMVRRDWPEFVSLFDKTLLALTPAEKQNIQNHWYSLKYDERGWRSFSMVATVTTGVLAIALLSFLYRNRQLRVRAQQTTRQLKHLEDNLPGALCEFVMGPDGVDGFRYFSDPIHSLLGYTPREFIERTNLFNTLIHPDDLSRFVQALQQSRNSDQPLFIELRMLYKDSIWKWIQLNAAPQTDADNHSIWSGHLLDISERKRLQQQADRAAIIQQENEAISRLLKEKDHLVATMLQDNRNAATSALSASIAHELNQPLGATSLNIQFLKRQLERNELTPGISQEILNNLDEDNQRAANIIQSLRSIFLDTNHDVPTLNLSEQIQEVLTVVRPLISEADITLDVCFSPGLYVAIHKNELQKVLLNLITNAIEAFALPSKRLDNNQPKTITITSSNVLDQVQFCVADNGNGIPTDKIPSLFELISSDDNKPTGVGLWLCQHIIHRYGGRIWYEQSELSRTRFIVELPAQKDSGASMN